MKKGFGLLEIVIAVAIVSTAIFALSFVFLISNKLEARASNQTRSNFLDEEGLEVLHFMRDKSWSVNLAPLNASTIYYLNFDPATSAWSIQTTDPGLIDNLYSRSFVVEAVNRDNSDNIVTSGGNLDPNTKKFVVKVSWQERGITSSTTVSTYLSDVFTN